MLKNNQDNIHTKVLIDINSVPQAVLTEYLTPEKERANVNKSHRGD